MDQIKKRTFYVKSKNREMRSGDNTDDILIKLLESFLENYEREENTLKNESDYVFDCVDWTLVNFHIIELRRGSSYIPSPKWVSDRKETINPQNKKDNCCFAYSIIAALHHQDISHNPERITKLKPHINNYNWKDIDFPARSKEYKIFERNNKDIALNILSVSHNQKEINITYKSNYNRTREKQVHLLMITDNEGNWHYFAVKSTSRLFRGVTSNNNCDFYCLNWLHSYCTENALKNHERLCSNHDYCEIIMPTKDKNIVKYNSAEKSLKVANVIYFDLETLQIKQQSAQNNPIQSYTETKAFHDACGYSLALETTYSKRT